MNIPVSIITVCFNSELTIKKTIDSVNYQTYCNIRHIFIDGSSSDSTLNVINDHAKRDVTVVSENDSGIYDAMNKGLELCSADSLVFFLNSDDHYASSTFIHDVVKIFESNLSLLSILLPVRYQDRAGRLTRYYSSIGHNKWHFRLSLMPPHLGFVTYKHVYSKYGLFDSCSYKIAADFELLFRFLYINNLTFKAIDLPGICMLEGGVSSSGLKSYLQISNEIALIFKRHNKIIYCLFIYFRFLPKILFRR